jgi:hypothetical protein
MTSRELVQKTLKFQSPPRIPRQLWLLPWATENHPQQVIEIQNKFPDDIVSSPAFLKEKPKTVGDPYLPGVFVDEWGCAFENLQQGIIGIVHEPLVKDWKDSEKVRMPTELLSVDREKVNAFCNNADKFVLSGCCPRPFERLQFIRTSENLFVDLFDPPEEFFILLKKIHQFYIEELELWANTEVDALTFMDDWGSQNSLLINPKLWREIFKPLYRDYIDIAHRHGKYAFMHSDGYILDILPDLVELGLDALNAQIFCMEVEKLGKEFKGKITFWGEIDRQYLLPYGAAEEVIAAIKKVKASLYQNGGVIAQCEFGPGAKPENVVLVFETWNNI